MTSRILSFGLVSWLAVSVLVNIPSAKAEENLKIEAREEINVLGTESVIAQAEVAEITDIQVSQTAAGVVVTLVSVDSLSVSTSRTSRNALIIEIPNATLNLVDATAAEQFGPVKGIAVVSVTEGIEGQVQIAITGTDAPPVAEITTDSQGLVLAVELGDAEAAVAATDEDAIRLVVTAATRVEASALDVPQSIQVIPGEVIENRAANSVVEALRTSPGIISSFDNSLFSDIIIRGFEADFRRNGLTNDIVRNTNALPSNIERLEVLRGPASVLYGQGSFGGTVNVITEKPTDEPFYSLDATVGSFDRYGVALDLSGPINQERTVKYRLNLAAETEDSFIDDASRQRYLVAPVLAWAPNEKTDINFEIEYSSLNAENNFGLPAKGTVLPNINGELDRGRYIGDADTEFREINSLTIGYDLEHRFSDNWRIHNAAQYTLRESPEFSIFEFELLDDERTLERGFAETNKFDFRNYLFETYAVGNFNRLNRK